MTNQEINEAVARKMGLHECSFSKTVPHHYALSECDGWHGNPKPYATRIEAAWELCEWWNKKNPFNITRLEFWDGKWNCQFGPVEDMKWIAQADNAPRAICLAFLKLNG